MKSLSTALASITIRARAGAALLLMAAALVSGSYSVRALPLAPTERVQQSSPCREQIRSWAMKEILPVVRVWKNEFDAKLSGTELAQLNELRIKAQPLRLQREQLGKKIALAMRNRDEQAAAPLRAEMRELRNSWEDLTEQLIPIARAHRDELRALGEKAKPVVREWRAAMRAKISECMASKPEAQTEAARKIGRFLDEFLSDERQESPAMRKRAAARFLLWDGTTLPQEEQFGNAHADADVNANASADPNSPLADKTNLAGTFTLAQCSPNPVSGSSTSIRFSLSQAGHVKISVLDIHGNEVDVIADRSFAAGTAVLEYNASSLVNGQYSLRLVCPEGMLYTGMIIAR
ncbi:MAG: hypothetical protein RL156_1354 [Bacteroidota bacterium]